ncbi:hypothetical protein KX816_07465 [Sphingosinicellaceae bacterium]|nr:hypothetical protein KX816_07465 [Sphingosinicellaceae bacterium]
MRTESFVLTVLPLTLRPDAGFHVSLHVAPRLVPDAVEEPLRNFDSFVDWAATARAATIELLGNAGAIAATPLVERIDAGLWSKVFPPDTIVRRPRFDSFPNRAWRTFPVKAVHDIAAVMPLLGTMLFPVDPPDLRTYVAKNIRGQDFKNPVARLIGQLGSGRGRAGEADEVALTAQLDHVPGAGSVSADSPWKALLEPLHAARRYYDRPEARRAYQDIPTENLAPKPLDKPMPDFHERVAHLADQPELLRRLGLVIDVHVDDLAGLKAAIELHAGMAMRGSAVSIIAARTPVTHSGGRLLSVPRTDDWTVGRLKLGDTKRYSVLAMDSDGGALKAEAFIRSLPRMQAMAVNGDPGHVAPPALRSEGLTLVQTGKLASVQAQLSASGTMVASSTPAAPPSLRTEDLTRGYRVEIWDDHVKKWFTPHARLTTATVAGLDAPVYTDLPERGYVQTAAVNETPGIENGPLYLHEAMFGWSGWSLSAPRPGPRAEPFMKNGKQHEAALEAAPPADPVSPVQVTTKVAHGTLPRLRYGRSYMFRAWSVDLAGNSPGDPVPVAAGAVGLRRGFGAVGGPARATVDLATFRPALERISSVRATPLVSEDLPGIHGLALSAAGATTAAAPTGPAEALIAFQARSLASDTTTPGDSPPVLTGFASIDSLALSRLQARPRIVAPPIASLAGSAALTDALKTVSLEPRVGLRSETLGPVIAHDLDGIELNDVVTQPIDPAVFTDLTDQTLTPLTPFRRWDTVPPPVVVARHRLSIAESIHHLVIRSGLLTSPDGAGGETTTVLDPEAFIASLTPAFAADLRPTCERHLAAPKGSQILNELHGRFDPALGTGTPEERRLMLAAALRDDGTLFDQKIVSLDDPLVLIEQPGVSLQAGPEIADPVTDLGTLQDGNRGNPPPVGHYVIHDVDELVLPWLPDPMAAGIAFGMNTANKGSPLVGAFRVESTAAPYLGDWPAPQPFRLVVETATDMTATVRDRVVTIGIPPGERLDLRLSSSLRRADLPLFALWGLLPASLTSLDLFERPAADGQFWALTPYEPISLIHAVPRPVLPPLNTAIVVGQRVKGETGVGLGAVIDVHAASTDRIDAEASWSEWIDDLTADGPVREAKRAVPFHAQVDYDEDMVLLGPANADFAFPGVGAVRIHRARHEFGDTRHRVVDYAFRATTRYREYFPPALLATPESRSVLGVPTTLSLLSTAAPPAPIVDSVIPLFRWDESDDPGQPFGIRRRRRAGLRVYLRRPWFRSGDDEQLAVIITSNGEDAGVHTSVWGSDPVWFNAGPAVPLVGLSVEDLYGAAGIDGVRGPDPRLSLLKILPAGGKLVSAIGYRPEYNAERQLWFVDVAIEPAASVWAFVRLAVARYQPNSLQGLELSPIVLCDFTQLLPERTMTVSRPDVTTVRVTVSGPAGLRESAPAAAPGVFAQKQTIPTGIDPGALGVGGPYPLGAADPTNAMAKDRRVYAVLEHREPGDVSDLDWHAVHRQELSIGGLSAAGEFAWTGVIDIGTSIPLGEPGQDRGWRITVEEHEGIEGDPAEPNSRGPLVKQWRLIYADRTLL